MYGKAAAAVLAGLCLVNRPPTVRAQSTFAGQSCAASDTNGDGSVDVRDLLALLASFDCTYDSSSAVEADVCTVDMSASFNWVELVGADGATMIADGDWTSGAQNTWESDDGWVDVDVGMLGNCFNWCTLPAGMHMASSNRPALHIVIAATPLDRRFVRLLLYPNRS